MEALRHNIQLKGLKVIKEAAMGLGDYQLILFSPGNMPELNDVGMDFVGPDRFDFTHAVHILELIDYVRNYSPQDKWPSFDFACYYLYDNGGGLVKLLGNNVIKRILLQRNEKFLRQTCSYSVHKPM